MGTNERFMKKWIVLTIIVIMPSFLFGQKTGEQIIRPAKQSQSTKLPQKKKPISNKVKMTEYQRQVIQTIIDNMIYVEGGTCIRSIEKGKKEKKISVSSFHIGKYEVTQKEWETIMGFNPSKFKGNNRPVDTINKEDCYAFLRKLNKLSNITFRLPTQDEWTYVAWGGKISMGYIYPGDNIPENTGWIESNSNGVTHDVGLKKPNELGVYDMLGNVGEWIADRNLRMGGWWNARDYLWEYDGFIENSAHPGNRYEGNGFRIAF